MANPYFNATYYLTNNPDLIRAGITVEGAWNHYVNYGAAESLAGAASRNPAPWFDPEYYLNSNPDVLDALLHGHLTQGQLFDHFTTYGIGEGRAPSQNAVLTEENLLVYAKANEDLLTAFGISEDAEKLTQPQQQALASHFYQYGYKEDRPGAPFDPNGGVGDVFTLTTGADVLTGTAKNDTFVGGEANGNKTLTAGDDLDGGAGIDTLRVLTDNAAGQNYAGFTLSNIEVLDATSDGGAAGQVFDLSGATGLTTLRSTNSSAQVAFNQVTSLANVEVNNLTGASNVTVQYQDPVVAGTADAVNLTVNNSQVGVVTLGSVANGTGGIETVNLSAVGQATTIGALNTNLTTLNISGDQNITIATALNGNALRTIDAAAATGNVTVSTNTANALSFTGGAGNDQVTFAAGTLTAADTVVGGAGEDRLVANQAELIAAASKVSGVEFIRVQDTLVNNVANAANVLNAARFAEATRFELAQGYNTARIDDLNATQQRVDILNNAAGGNIGTLTIDDGATSFVDDQFTLALGQTGQNNQVNATVGFVSGEIETINLISNGDATTALGNTVTLNQGMGNVTKLNITGAEDLTVTTVGSVINSVDGATATGNLNLTGVNYAATSGATIVTGSGNDVVTGSARADIINVGAGNDTVNGSAGADTITLGDGADTVVYTALVQSNSAATDTIVDFVSGTDRIDVTGLTVTTYAGTYATFDLAQGALAGGGVVSAVFDASSSRLWVDMDGNGTLDSNDFRVNLTDVTNLAATSVVTLGAPIALVAGANVGTTGSDLFTTTDAVLATVTSVDGLDGVDTLRIIDPVTARNLQTLNVTNVERVVLDAGTIGAGLTIHNQADVVVNAGAASTVALGAATGQTFNGSAGGDVVTLGSTNQIVNAGAGNDTVNSSVAILANANLNFGAGTDTLNVTTAGTVDLRGGAGATTVSGLENVTLTGSSTLLANINNLTTTVGAGDTIVTNSAATQTVDASGLGGNTLTLDGSAASTVTNLGAGTTNGNVIVAAGAGATTVQVDVTVGATTHTITNASANLVTVDATGGAAGGAQTVTLTGAGDFAVIDAGGASGMAVTVGAGSSGAVNLSSLDGATTLVADGTGSVNVDATGLTAALTITGAQNVTVTGVGGTGSVAAAGGTGAYTITTVAGTGAIDTAAGNDTITVAGAGARTVDSGLGSDSVTIDSTAGVVTLDFTALTGSSSLVSAFDTITGFRAGTDKMSSDIIF